MSSIKGAADGEHKSRIGGLVLAAIVAAAMVLLNLPYDYVEVDGKWLGGLELDERNVALASNAMPTMAGWPVCYRVEYGEAGDRDLRYWSTAGMLVNVGFALCLSALVYLFLQLRSRRTSAAVDQVKTRMQFDICIAVAILVAPLALFAWSYRTAHRHQQLVFNLPGGASAYLSCWLPKPIADQAPSGLARAFLRLRTVRVIAPDQASIDRIMQARSLVALHCFGGDFDAAAIARLDDNVHFSSLQLRRRELSDADLDAIAGLRWLSILDLSGSNLDGRMLRRLDGLQRLESLSVRDTPLKLANLGQPTWSATLRDLKLSRPQPGTGGSLKISGWPQLRQLSLTRASATLNAPTMTIHLADLPQLQLLRLDRVQKHSLTIHNVPRLTRIDEGGMLLEILMSMEIMHPSKLWVEDLEIDGADSLSRLGLFVRDMKSLSIRGVPSLRHISLGSYLETSMGAVRLQPTPAKQCQKWIQRLGELVGPSDVDLFGLPLAECDLSPLSGNSRIRRLRLGASGVSFEQVRSLAGMRHLESLDISDCPLEEDQLSWLLEKFPELEELVINGASLARFDPAAGQRLRIIRTNPLEHVEEIRVVDLPQLQTFIATSRTPRHLEIRNAQALKGLIIKAPWPQHGSISGLRDLICFVGGGAAIDDDVMDHLLQCHRLDQLTLAYTSISADKLRKAGRLDRLSVLALPGAAVDDEVASHWGGLTGLWELNLDDTSVSTATIAWASEIESLRRLSLNRVELNQAAQDALGMLRHVSELHLAGTTATIDKLKPLFEIGNLEALNLSGQRVDSDFIETLGSAPSLRHLILHDSNVDADSLRRILASNPSLYVDLGETPEYIDDQLAAELKRRAQVSLQQLNTGWRNLIRLRASARWRDARTNSVAWIRDDGSRRVSAPAPALGVIDRQVFRPASLKVNSIK